MAEIHRNVIPFPVRSGNPKTSDPNIQLLKAARAAHAALLLAVPQGEKLLVIRRLGEAIRAFDRPEPPKTPAPAKQQARCESMRSPDADLTGERAVQCNAPADVECEQCGDMCGHCAGETSCFGGHEHRFIQPERKQPAIVKLTESAAAHILRNTRSKTCFCGSGKASGKPFCLRCYHSLPERMRASMYLSPLDSNQIFDAILEARSYLARLGMLSANEAIA
jgi:hypothetical protein